MTNTVNQLLEEVKEMVKSSQALEMYEDMLVDYKWNNQREMLKFFAAQNEEDLVDWAEAVLAVSEDENISLQEAADRIAAGPEDWESSFEEIEI